MQQQIFLVLALLFSLPLGATDAPNVLIIGGGPAGLATAIEAHAAGASVRILEKRDGYTREQPLILTEQSVQLLDGWSVQLPTLKRIDLGDGREKGLIAIQQLEAGLQARLAELGIAAMRGTFLTIDSRGLARVEIDAEEQLLDYDLLVAADGMHSRVREAAGIGVQLFGIAEGQGNFLHFDAQRAQFGISEAIAFQHGHVRRISTPAGSLVFTQAPAEHGVDDLLLAGLQAAGWHEEIEVLRQGQLTRGEPIELRLQQATAFVSRHDRVLVLGDAAATASFFEGLGANTALLGARAAGVLLQHYGETGALEEFEQSVAEATDLMIEANRYLF